MKKKTVRAICLLLCLALLIAEGVAVFAASPVSDIESRLKKMSKVSQYRDASYTAFNGSLGKGCYAFVNALSRELFGTGIPSQKANSSGKYTLLNVSSNKNWYEVGVANSNSGAKTLLQSAQPGDIIQYSSKKTSRHIVMVFSVSSNGICRWGANEKQGAHFNNETWDEIAKSGGGFGDFTGNGYGMGLYRCTKNVKTGEIIDKNATTNKTDGNSGSSKITVNFSNYQVRKLTETSAEPYATATATGGLVKKVGMWIGTSEDMLYVLGTDNGKAITKKNMWYNTEKYGYPLEPGTTYYYQPFAEVDGKLYEGDIKSFTTKGEKVMPSPAPAPTPDPEPEPEQSAAPTPDPEPEQSATPAPTPTPIDNRSWQDQGWTSKKPAESDTLKITDTRTVTDKAGYTTYTYYHYWAKKDGKTKMSYGNTYWKNYEEVTVTTAYPYYKTYDGKYKGYKSPSTPEGKHGTIWWLKSTNEVPAQTHVEYRYSVYK